MTQTRILSGSIQAVRKNVRKNRKMAVKFNVYSSNCAAVGYMDGTCLILRTRVNINL